MTVTISPALVSAQPHLEAMQTAVQSMALATGGTAEVAHSTVTGLASFVTTTDDQPLPIKSVATAPVEERALAFVHAYGPAFGLQDVSQVQVTQVQGMDEVGMEHVRLQQLHHGVPVTAGELTVHLRGATVVSVLAKTVADLDTLHTTPTLSPDDAIEAAQAVLAKHLQVTDATLSKPRLEIFNRGLLEGQPQPSHLAWFLEATRINLRQFIWVDAHTGMILLQFNQLHKARNRRVHDARSTSTLPGVLRRSEGQPPTGDADVDNAYDYAGDTYDYFRFRHNRDSYDGAGATIISTVRYCEPGACPLPNAFWNGTQMVYGAGFASADDVVAHELTHAVTDRSAHLFYYMQSGALNESYSDIFGETVDLTNGTGTDTTGVRWLLGEDLPSSIGVIRNMSNPNAFGDPAKVSDPRFLCPNEPFGGDDLGGVHTNSGVPNKAYTLMVDGGTFNGITVARIGHIKAGKIQYRALTRYLISGSDFLDNYNALRRSCTDLVGTAGITNANCTQVTRALQAVEMPRPACRQTVAPPLCPAGQTLVSRFLDRLETLTSTRWINRVITGLNHWNRDNWLGLLGSCDGTAGIYCRGYATSGVRSFAGADIPAIGDSAVAMAINVPLPATGGTPYLYFNHAYDFEQTFDGGVIERSIDGGVTWQDARPLIDAGKRYDVGTLSSCCGNPLGGRPAFNRNSFGYTSTRLNLSTMAGSNVRFRFRMGTDESVESVGWIIDDIRIYQCR
jgi:Zn-dependent metalloprotease